MQASDAAVDVDTGDTASAALALLAADAANARSVIIEPVDTVLEALPREGCRLRSVRASILASIRASGRKPFDAS